MPTKVLVVDDDLDLTKMLDTTLTVHGFEVSTANTGPNAIEVAQHWEPDVIVLDLWMPDVDGWQVCREIRRFSQVPILTLSAVVDSQGVMRALEKGANDYLVKPVPTGVLVSKLRNIVRHPHGDREGTNSLSDL